MATTLGHWLLPQLERISKSHPERIDDLLQCVRSVRPELFHDLHMMAVENGQLEASEAAFLLGADRTNFEDGLAAYREAMVDATEAQLIEKDRHGIARIAEKHVSVWEVVREYRRAGSVQSIRGAFPSLSEGELRAALAYAGRNPDEVGAQIQAYEEIVERSKSAYPYAKGQD